MNAQSKSMEAVLEGLIIIATYKPEKGRKYFEAVGYYDSTKKYYLFGNTGNFERLDDEGFDSMDKLCEFHHIEMKDLEDFTGNLKALQATGNVPEYFEE